MNRGVLVNGVQVTLTIFLQRENLAELVQPIANMTKEEQAELII
ncbi:hypothetical protein QYY51_07745 [Enterobacter hormaechei]|nr:hypothetical protein [Enterobacter hormaechei]MDN4964042.1 hypothetical protein [Enterobacter hormaechei]MDO6155614.1 hypothetical protein [Enterobacter hormaechei]